MLTLEMAQSVDSCRNILAAFRKFWDEQDYETAHVALISLQDAVVEMSDVAAAEVLEEANRQEAEASSSVQAPSSGPIEETRESYQKLVVEAQESSSVIPYSPFADDASPYGSPG